MEDGYVPTRTFRFKILGYEDGLGDFDDEVEAPVGTPALEVAEVAAEQTYLYSGSDRWRNSFPIQIEVFDGTLSLGMFTVDVEDRPKFTAKETS